ncbi:MAG TPA: secretin N-terminal domain-containing protein [Verrucomicrobiae bacterium]|nr:secretin N-terminal domain-containing protein [Verrucomicrobiae bacterium]
MKTTTLFLILFLTGLGLWAQTPPDANAPAGSNGEVAGYQYNYASVTVDDLLDKVYSPLVGRTLLRAPGLPLTTTIVLKTVTPLTKTEAIGALQAVLSMNGVAVINIGDKFVKVLPVDQAGGSGAKIDTNDVDQLPELGTYVTHIVHLNYVKPSAMQPIIAPFAKLAGGILPLDDAGVLVLRDNAENVKRMLEMIAQVDVGGMGSEIISEVIPIKYALAEDIANALNSLGGSSGGTVSIGSAPTQTKINGIGAQPAGSPITTSGSTGSTYQPGGNGVQGSQPRAFGSTGTTPNGTPAAGGTFQSRLLSLVNRASQGGGGQEPIQIFGQTKIIADQRSNSLLIFATRQDMDAITNVIAKLDVLLSQVLIESVIIDVDLTKALQLGVSAAQNPKVFSPSQGIAGGGGSVNFINNGSPSFYNFLASNSTFGTNGSTILGNSLSSGFSYFGNIGQTWDVALQAIANDSSASVIQRPRIQTSQAKAASFFVGQTVPYITGNYAYSGVAQNSYSQLSVGVELDVTPFINPDGLVVMDINQEIDDIENPNYNNTDQPSTTKRTLNSEIAVKDKDTVMLGGFIRSDKNNSKSGIPYLADIPLIGNLFSQHTSNKDRSETVVLIRPTVLRTPELAAAQAITEQNRLPGVSRAVAEDARDERKQVEAEAKTEADETKAEAMAEAKTAQKSAKSNANDNRVFLPALPDGTVVTNTVPLNR